MLMLPGGDGRFDVDATTGEVRVAARRQFELTESYELGVSAQCVGTEAALSRNTPAQLVRVHVDDVNPQFFSDPYIIEVNEDSNVGTRYVTYGTTYICDVSHVTCSV